MSFPYAEIFWSEITENRNMFSSLIFLLSILLSCHYVCVRYLYNQAYLSGNTGQRPPRYPYLIPYVGNLVSFVWDNAGFMTRATSYAGKLTSARVLFLGWEVYVFQDRETVKEIWNQKTLSSPFAIFQYVFKFFFGMSEANLSVYRTDDSGPFRKPYANSKVAADDRVEYMTIASFHRALNGPGLAPTTRRFMRALVTRTAELQLSEEWTEIPDLLDFFHHHVGASLVESIFGPTLLRLNPDFIDDMWEFDDNIPWLARAVPSWIMPKPYQVREKIVSQFKRWYVYARQHFHESCISEDGDGDPFWGSYLTRYRQKSILQVKNHDDDMLARTDMGLVWGAIGNTIPSAMMAMVEIIKDPDLLRRVRSNIQTNFGSAPLVDVDHKSLSRDPLLSSIYAETLRLYVKTYFMVSSPHTDVPLGKWVLPKGKIGLLNAGLSHMDTTFWNTKNGQHPVDSFWADRFLIYPSDPSSGPVNPSIREAQHHKDQKARTNEHERTDPVFSMDGTEGSWFPYGGGYSICPGRFLAKSAILFTCAHLATEFDIELMIDSIETTSWRFGLGVARPEHSIPFRIRKRK
ncbi:Pfs, NACHT and ankyrin domain protein [Biscogniauxia mediterranea]|nr:Pfs, NACHT and ankyrin domain protein [Biscogniauxia mediterranea]